jgi:hypothetical protein
MSSSLKIFHNLRAGGVWEDLDEDGETNTLSFKGTGLKT